MNFFDFKDFNDMCQKMGFTTEQGLSFLDQEIKNREGKNNVKQSL